MKKTIPTPDERLEPFDFDYWRQLAEEDPESFENLRNRMIDEVIDSSPEPMRKRLRGLQWRIDMEIRRSRNALDSCIRLNRMMLDSVYAKDGLVDSVRNLAGSVDRPKRPAEKAAVIPLRR